MFVNVVVTLIVFFMFKLYHSLWEFAGTAEAENIVAACLLCTALTFIGLRILNYPIPRSYYFYYGLILLFITIAGRFSYRTLRNFRHKQQNKKNGIRVMIIGAGDAGNTVIKEITNSNYSTMTIKCIIDDNPKYLADAPVAIIIVSALITVPSSIVASNGFLLKSTLVTNPARMSVPKRSA